VLFGLHLLSKKKAVVGSIITLFGVILQLNKLDIIYVNVWQLIVPFALIALGANMILNKKKSKRRVSDDYIIEKNFEINNVFSSDYKNVNSPSLESAEVFSLFGGSTVNMSNSSIATSGFNLELTAIFGSVEVILPEDCTIEIKGSPMFGKINDRSRLGSISTKKAILDCTCVFGEIEIKN
jgi:predicted membrane protein